MPTSGEKIAALQVALRGKTLRAMLQAMEKVDRVADGTRKFVTVHEMRACLTLARLASVVLVEGRTGAKKPDRPTGPRLHPSHSPEEAKRLLKSVWRRHVTARAEKSAEAFARRFREEGPAPPDYTTEEEARNFGRRIATAEMEAQATVPDDEVSDDEEESW